MPGSICRTDVFNLARLLALATCVGFAAPAATRPFDYGPLTNIPVGGGAWAVAAGDMDGDGRTDVVATLRDNVVRVHLQTDSAMLPLSRSLLVPGVEMIELLRMVDLDDDGRQELVVGHRDGLSILFPSGEWRHVSSLVSCDYMAVGDIDRDGRPDLACLAQRGYIAIYSNQGHGTVSAPTYLWTPAYVIGTATAQLQLGDVTGDGLPDLVAATSAAPGFYVHENNGAGGFHAARGYAHATPAHPLSPNGAAIIDVDADGVEEIVVASGCNNTCASLHVHKRDPLGFFRYVEQIPSHEIPAVPIARDIDGDGFKDLLVVHAGWDAVSRYMGGATGLSRTGQLSPVSNWWASDNRFALGDVSSDGCDDLVSGSIFGISVLLGRCAGAASDFDGDGGAEVLWRNMGSGENTLWQRGPEETWGVDGPLRRHPLRAVTDLRWQIAGLGDFDGDGRADILWRHAASGANTIWRAAGHDRQTPVTAVTNTRWQVAGVGDFDGDGSSDILWRNLATGANVIWRHGRYATQIPVRAVTDVRWHVAGVGDFDGDGRADVLWRHAASGKNVIWRSARADAQQPVTGVTDVRWQVAGVGDFSGDGRADILWRHSGNGRNVVWKGADSNAQQAVATMSDLGWKVAAVADYDDDGYADIFWRNLQTGDNLIWSQGDHEWPVPVAPVAGRHWTVIGR